MSSLIKRPDPENIRVTIGFPGYGHVPALCMLSLGSFIAHGVANGYVHNIGSCIGAYIDRARNDIVRQALSNKSTHLFFVDQDMVLPEMALTRLLSHKRDVVGGLYFGKDDLFTPVAFNFDGPAFRRVYDLADDPAVYRRAWMPDEHDDLTCPCGKPDDHTHAVGGVGMGCALVTTRLFRKMKNYFGDEEWFSSKECGEDVHFARRCEEMGIPIYLDGFINCGHVRDQLVARQHYDWARQQGEN